MRIVDAAFTSGVTENRTIEYTFTGKVTVSGPEVKKVMTKSSSERVNARSAPATSPGSIHGTSTSRNACHSDAPRSRAASSSSRLKFASRARTTTATKGKLNEMWAMVIAPRLRGHGRPVGHPIRAKNASIATPMQISGMTMGSAIAASCGPLNGNRNRHRATAARVPSTVLARVLANAMVSELVNASMRESLFQAFS